MSANATLDRIRALAARAVLGHRVKHPIQSAVSEGREVTPDDIGEARGIAAAFAGRLRELAGAREAMDSAVARDRAAAGLDFAGVVAKGEELPDLEAVASDRGRAVLKTRALWQLANREAEGAGRAVHLVKAAAVREAREAEQEARAWVIANLPPAFELPASVATAARPVFDALALVQAAEKAPSLRLVTAELFGQALPKYRIDPLPERPAILPPDGFDPEQAAREIEQTLAVHAAAIRHRLALAEEAKPATRDQ